MRSYIVFIMLLLGMNMNVMAQSETLHIVKRGESFALIAKRYGMTEEELKAANPDYSVCYMGLKLNIPEKYAKAIQVTSVASPESVSGLSASYSQEDFTKSATVASKQEKKKGNFWKKLGDIASNVGDIAVSVASGMDEAGLLDKTGKAGEAIGGTADMVNMLRGQESSYLVSATGEDKYAGGNEKYTVEASASVACSSSVLSSRTDVAGLQNRLAYVNNRINEISQELATLAEEKLENKYKQWGAVSKVAANQRKNQNVKNNTVSQRKCWANAGIQAQQSYVQQNQANSRRCAQLKQEQNQLVVEKKSLIQRINALQRIETDYSSSSSSSSSNGSGHLVTVTCDYCNGLKKNPHPSDSAAPDVGNITHCSICDITRPHIHKPCPKCKGTGKIQVFR